ncbi:uncharacterized protein LOC135840884 [Planococcus citri]|uniref:uncharacterized protein LOC135840884 n=1 Tax=Planococcus citri TaxID=170843 RepID=UPI0031F92B31
MGPDSQMILRFGNKGLKNAQFSLLLVGSSNFCRLMYDTITSLSLKYLRIPVNVSVTESIENILTSSAPIHVDFIVFLMDTKERNSIEQVERNLCLVEPIYLCDRIVLVNCCNHLGTGNLGLSVDELSTLCQKYRLQMIHGNIEEEESRENIAKRIVHFSSVICGVKTGMPMVFDFPNFLF